MELKSINLKNKVFKTEEHTYTILDDIPLGRYKQYQKLMLKLSYGVDFQTLHNNLNQIITLTNTPGVNTGNIAILTNNILKGVEDLDDETRYETAFVLCTLFIVREDEDITVYNKEFAVEKIQDWVNDGYGARSFFHAAVISIHGLTGTFNEFIDRQIQEAKSSN